MPAYLYAWRASGPFNDWFCRNQFENTDVDAISHDECSPTKPLMRVCWWFNRLCGMMGGVFGEMEGSLLLSDVMMPLILSHNNQPMMLPCHVHEQYGIQHCQGQTT